MEYFYASPVVFALESVVCAPLLDCGKSVESKTGFGFVAPVRRLILSPNPATT
jgi:hypothetical protein